MTDFYGRRAELFLKKLPEKHQQLIERVRKEKLKGWIKNGKAQQYRPVASSNAYVAQFSFDDGGTGTRVGYWLCFYQRTIDGEIVLIDVK